MDFTAQDVKTQEFAAKKAHFRTSLHSRTLPGRVIHAFDCWALVPAADLLMLRHAIESFSHPGVATDAETVLHLVDEELRRRSAVLPAAGQVS